MCGISGVAVAGEATEKDRDAVSAMVRAQTHRGPDRQNMLCLETCVLGHDRLCILDLSKQADQPMTSAGGRFHMVFNGELYNYAALRDEMKKKGTVFRTTSDSEVLLELFASEGPACLHRLNGMFAFAVWDAQKRRLFLARDRFGQKPLFYAAVKNRFLFASEVMVLFRHPCMERHPNLNALYHYLSAQSVPAPFSAFKGVYKVPPAHWLEWHDGEIKLARYWNPENLFMFQGSAAEAEEELDALLNAAVSRHLVSDVPVGLFLSGGVDSSLISALACRKKNGLRSFCVGFALPEYDERPFARKAAVLCGSRHTEAAAAPDVAAMLPRMAFHYGEPFADSSALPTWLLCATARKDVTVALSGDGGDDLFGGYERYLNPLLFAAPPYPDDVRRLWETMRSCLAALPAPCAEAPELSPAAAKYFYHWARFDEEQKRRLCTPALRDAARPPLTLCSMLAYARSLKNRPLLDIIQRFELDYYLASVLMPKVDIAAMAVSLEVRAPLLDAAVGDFALSLPVPFRVRRLADKSRGSFHCGLEPKWLLKKTAARYLPPSLIYRRKQGFGTPLNAWLKGPLRPLVEEELLSPQTDISQWLDRAELARMTQEHMSGAANHQYRLWTALMLALWARHCLRGALP